MNKIKCRFCGEELEHTFVELAVEVVFKAYKLKLFDVEELSIYGNY